MRQMAIVGGNGGIGSALMDTLARRWPSATVCATHRNPEAPPHRRQVRWRRLDLENAEQIGHFSQHLNALEPSLDLLIVASGWLHSGELGPEKSARDIEPENLERAMRINATGPLALIAQALPALRRQTTATPRAQVIVLSAKVGSIGDNHLGGWYAYRMSKAALNMGIRSLGIECSRSKRMPIVTAVHPGTTTTALSAPFAKHGLAVVSPEVTASRLLQFIERANDSHQGGFFHWNGERLPW